ncbi:hypothetical protein NEOLEDRAFT_1244645 [Neolentinus lepideus HHB14362 ss-1]|uniref:Uncharacterized protein n=1 Tax=Neolentinus lepideus HHB14362 ss-1 TaxID=1314782 RepID=A0A165PNF6_9AGAM|nr:hypothetical protein NEOLEDRAFT_1244645 [Neolentinus lepideus HHB14362 ss-1]
MGVRTVVAAAATPFACRVFSSRKYDRKGKTPEDVEAPLLAAQPASQILYGAVQPENGPNASGSGRSSVRGSPERSRRDSGLDRVPEEGGPADEPLPGEEQPFEEADEERQWDLEEHGLYEGSYRRLVSLYTIIPFVSFFIFVLLALLPTITWPSHHPLGYNRYLPFPYPELLISISLWSLSHHLRLPLFNLASFLLPPYPAASTLLSTTLHVVLQTLFRTASFILIGIQIQNHEAPHWHEQAFLQVWWLALGWALADISVGIAQGYNQIALYKDVLVSEQDTISHVSDGLVGHSRYGKIFVADSPVSMSVNEYYNSRIANGNGRDTMASDGTYGVSDGWRPVRDSVQEMEKDLDAFIAFKTREELEDVYGIPVIKIPVFVSCLQRIDTLLLSLGLSLLLGSAYLRSALSLPVPSEDLKSNLAFYIVAPIVVLVHLFLAVLYTPVVLPRIGVHTASYVGLLVGLGCLFSGLGMWGALS